MGHINGQRPFATLVWFLATTIVKVSSTQLVTLVIERLRSSVQGNDWLLMVGGWMAGGGKTTKIELNGRMYYKGLSQ